MPSGYLRRAVRGAFHFRALAQGEFDPWSENVPCHACMAAGLAWRPGCIRSFQLQVALLLWMVSQVLMADLGTQHYCMGGGLLHQYHCFVGGGSDIGRDVLCQAHALGYYPCCGCCT